MRTQPPQSLDLPEIVDLLNRIKVVLHTLDGHILACLDALCLQHFGESTFSLLRNESVFYIEWLANLVDRGATLTPPM